MSPSSLPPRRIIVSHCLPLRCTPDPSSPFHFSFSLDPDSLPLQLSSSLPSPSIFVGSLPGLPSLSVSDELSNHLFSQFNCLPVFLPSELHHNFYDRFCKRYLGPLLHSVLPFSDSFSHGGNLFDRALYDSFLSANIRFAARIIHILNVKEDIIWVHDYHLIPLASFLRRKLPHVQIGLFLHSPFPTSENFRPTPIREDLLCSLLNYDMVGFQTSNYARNFLSSCVRLPGVKCQSNKPKLDIEYYGRYITVKILSVGVDTNQLRLLLASPETVAKIRELREKYQNQVLMVGIDDLGVFKGVGLKFLAMEKLLEDNPEWQKRRLVLVQIMNLVTTEESDVRGMQTKAHVIRDRVNAKFGQPGYEPIVLIQNKKLSMYEKAAFYAISECCIINAVRGGLNRIPYTYTVCRELSPSLNDSAKKSAIVVSEFVGRFPSLSGAIRVNPWDIESVLEGMISALSMSDMEKQCRHEIHLKYINSHDVTYWAKSFNESLQRACQERSLNENYYCMGFGMNFRVVALGLGFENLSVDKVVTSYQKTCNRLILLDYDGTMLPHDVTDRRPTDEVIEVVNQLCANPLNVVFVVSGRRADELAQWFKPCEKLGIAAEHGYHIRWNRESAWETPFYENKSLPLDWINAVMPLMQLYTEGTDGSYIELKESALVWHYHNADSDFGSSQANDLMEILEFVLANEHAVVKKGRNIVEITPQGISKGVAVETIINTIKMRSKSPDFVLCIGDDCSDEDMFEAIRNHFLEIPEVFACTIGYKPSMAKYYLDDTSGVLKMLEALI